MSRTPRLVYENDRLRALAMPLGGIGCGSVAICGDGGLRQWQIFNNIYHNAQVPHSFFAVRAQVGGAQPVARVLMSGRALRRRLQAGARCFGPRYLAVSSRRARAPAPGGGSVSSANTRCRVHYEDNALPSP
jgi:hypothetical protein